MLTGSKTKHIFYKQMNNGVILTDGVTHKRNFKPSKYQADEILLAVQGSQTQSAREGGRRRASRETQVIRLVAEAGVGVRPSG